MYLHHVPSSTSFSDNDEEEDLPIPTFYGCFDLVVTPAQWASNSRSSLKNRRPTHAFSPISYIPAEILINIFKYLYPSRDLYSALRVCRTWCECSVELLWHKPVFQKFATLEKLIRLLASPNLTFTYTKFIRRLNFLPFAESVEDDTLSALSQCIRLERLTLVNCSNLTNGALTRVLPNFSNLVAIDLSGVVNATNEAIIGLARSARRLQGINLAGCREVTDAGIFALAHNCPLLRRVKLSNLEALTDAPVSALAMSCPLLLEVDLNHCHLITDLSIRDIWTYSTHMREMRLSNCPSLTDAAFPAPLSKELARSQVGLNPFPSSVPIVSDELPPLILTRSFEHLRLLDLTSCALVTDDAIEGIIAGAPKIRNLVLSKCVCLTDRAVETICLLGRHLHYLHLGHASKITDVAVKALARSCTRLRYIDFANCTLLTDMSVFELSSLAKLRRVGLVRVSNLTDEAIYALAERHATLERIHLSYCDQITVMAIHFLLQKLHKLTHLSLTGVPAFRQPELQRFCRPPPADFSTIQASAFCVYSGKGVSQLRVFLTELFDHLTEGTDDTEYEDNDYDPEAYHEEETPEPQFEEDSEVQEDIHVYLRTPVAHNARPRLMQSGSSDSFHQVPTAAFLPPSFEPTPSRAVTRLQGAATRLNAQIMAAAVNPTAGPSRRSNRGIVASDTHVLPVIERSQSTPSDTATSDNNQTTGTFFRDGIPSRNNGMLTPELNFAEIGHGRSTQSSAKSFQLRRGHGNIPHQRPDSDEPRPQSPTDSETSNVAVASPKIADSDSTPIATTSHRRISDEVVDEAAVSVNWPYREPASPGSPTFPSVQSTTGIHGNESRGRNVRRSLRNTLNVAEQYASSLLFGRSPTRAAGHEGDR